METGAHRPWWDTGQVKILQVATLMTPDGAYGGPVRVATNQVRALRALGHDVTLIAGASGFDDGLPTTFDGAPVTLFPSRHLVPGLGFAATVAPSMLVWLRRHAREFDIVHFHLARDLVMLPAARLVKALKVPYVVQTHGMIVPSDSALAKLVDPLFTIPILRNASRVLSLTPEEDAGVTAVGGPRLPVERLLNGIVPSDGELATANRDSDLLDVLFLARLHPRKRPVLFAEVAARIISDHKRARFTIAGPDGGEAEAIDAVISEHNALPVLRRVDAIPPDEVSTRMSECDIYVLPSVDEPFPMSVLEAMDLGKPVIITDSCGLADIVCRHEAGLVIGPAAADLETALRALIDNSALRARLGANAAATVRSELSMESVAQRLESIYRPAS